MGTVVFLAEYSDVDILVIVVVEGLETGLLVGLYAVVDSVVTFVVELLR